MIKKLFKKKEKSTFQNFSVADQLAPMIITEEEDYLKIGNTYETTIIAVNYPTEKKLGWLSGLYDMEGNVSFTFHMDPTDNGSALKNIDTAVKKINYKLSQRTTASEKVSLEKEQKKLEKALNNLIENENNGFFTMGFSIRVRADTKKDLKRVKKRVSHKLLGTGITGYTPAGAMLDSFLTHLPYVKDKLFRYTAREMDSYAIASMFPFDSQDFGIKKGFAVGMNPNSKQQVNIDIRGLASHNMVLFGQTGQGKSKTMWLLMSRLYMDGARIIVIDPENEYGKPCRKMGGTTINVSNGTKDIINPLEVFGENTDNAIEDSGEKEIDDEEETRDIFSIHLQKKLEFFSLLAPTATELALAYVDDCLSELYKEYGISSETDFKTLTPKDYPILEDLYNKIEEKLENNKNKDLSDFQIILKKYVHGSNKKIFNGHTNVNLDNDFIVFNIKDLGQGTPMQTAAMSNTISYIWDLITNNVKETYLFVDEMHVLNNPRTPLSMAMLRDIYKRIRKYGESGAISATQQPSDALSVSQNGINYGAAVVQNSQIKILLPMEPQSIQDLRDKASMHFSEEEVNILSVTEDKVGEGLLLYANKKAHVQFQLSQTEWDYLGATPKVKEVA